MLKVSFWILVVVFVAALGTGMYMFHAWLYDIEDRDDKIGEYSMLIGCVGYILMTAVAIILYELLTSLYYFLGSIQ